MKLVRESLLKIQNQQINNDEELEVSDESHDFDKEDEELKENGDDSPGGIEPYESNNSSFNNNLNFAKGIHTR